MKLLKISNEDYHMDKVEDKETNDKVICGAKFRHYDIVVVSCHTLLYMFKCT